MRVEPVVNNYPFLLPVLTALVFRLSFQYTPLWMGAVS
jgi:hypothetical protein